MRKWYNPDRDREEDVVHDIPLVRCVQCNYLGFLGETIFKAEGEYFCCKDCEREFMKGELNMDIEKAYDVLQAASGIEVGDRVRVLRTNKHYELGSRAVAHSMKELEGGRAGIVSRIDEGRIIVDMDNGVNVWHLPFFVLEVIKKAEPEKMEDKKSLQSKLDKANRDIAQYKDAIRLYKPCNAAFERENERLKAENESLRQILVQHDLMGDVTVVPGKKDEE
ncbi:hypothetical protein LCGC14_1530490 [marine sediment metagenome]|uniref:Uncharacterized protein n=1 Tax=marine sediment metagenome TaxID=412755 RepID=A0A0F9LWW7_9ZZZZ